MGLQKGNKISFFSDKCKEINDASNKWNTLGERAKRFVKAANDRLLVKALYILWHFYVLVPRNFIFLITKLQVLQTISSVASAESSA